MNSQELLEKLHGLLEDLTAEHAKGSKAAQGRARKIASEIKKAANEYRKASVVESKVK
jgi:F0F1-type ATP synthase membrane subunit b/b'